MPARLRPTRTLLTILEALAIAWVLLYVGEYFGWGWVSLADGDIGLALQLQGR